MRLSKKLTATVLLGVFIAVTWTSFLANPTANFLTTKLNIARDSPLLIFLNLIILSLIIVLPISLLVSFVLSRLLVEPIKSFNRILKVIATGNLAQRIQDWTGDELGELGQNINAVIKNLVMALQSMATSLRNEKQQEKKLAASFVQLEKEKARDEALLTSINEGVIAVGRDQKIMMFNEAAARLTGFSQQESLNMPYPIILRFLNEKDESAAEDFIGTALVGIKQIKSNHIMLLSRDGQKIPVLYSAGSIITANQEITGVIIALRDITKERELDKMKDEFVSVASHELRTPMTAIKGLISMIFEGDYGPLNPDLKDPLNDIAISTERLIQLVNDMLDVSRIEAGRLKFILGDYPIASLVEEITSLMMPLAKEKGIVIEVNLPPEKVFTDPNKIKQILNNLIGNSLKFTDKGKILVSCKLVGELLNVSVDDTGAGISKEDQRKLFNKFSQISSIQTGKPKGTGLGLYISREFARKMGGDLWIERSEPQMGSTFTFSLPLTGTDLSKRVVESLKPYIDTAKPSVV